MKRMVTLFLLLLFAAGCRSGRPAAAADETSAERAVAEGAVRAAPPRLDSIVCGDGCTEYICYFTPGSRNRRVLERIRSVVFEGSVYGACFDACPDVRSADRLRSRILDSLRSLEWIEGEPWMQLRRLYLDWSEQQLEREYIVYRSERDPFFLYDCGRTDSVLIRCADLMIRSGERYADEVRRLLRAKECAKAERDSATFDRDYLKWALARIEETLSGADSVFQARERLFQLLSNHLNSRIHERLGEDGTVDFYRYVPDFLDLFDSVRVESYEP